MDSSQEHTDYHHGVYPFGNHFEGYGISQNYLPDFTNSYLGPSDTINHDGWSTGVSCHSNMYNHIDQLSSKDCRLKRKGKRPNYIYN